MNNLRLTNFDFQLTFPWIQWFFFDPHFSRVANVLNILYHYEKRELYVYAHIQV